LEKTSGRRDPRAILRLEKTKDAGAMSGSK
jgi:hypothetical protein